jgi:hypothetical protein
MTSELTPEPRHPMRTDPVVSAGEEFAAPNGTAGREPQALGMADERAFHEAERATRTALMDCYNG